ncbi:MAG: hypothetical protein ACLPWS_13125 [Rhodomicrobium sp.]
MSESREAKILKSLAALFEAIAEEALANPSFAGKVEASLAKTGALLKPPRKPAAPAAPKDSGKMPTRTLLHNVTFDPLECHIEAALISGREDEARAFLGKLDRGQLEEVVKAQRLPGAKSLHKAILEADAASAVDAIVGSAAERVRNRLSAGR